MEQLKRLVREDFLSFKAYSTARDEFDSSGMIYLDANENPLTPPDNRYPDPHHHNLKKSYLRAQKDLDPRFMDYFIGLENIFCGNGSDETISLLTSLFCEPRQDSVYITRPSYGMYEVSARTIGAQVKTIDLDENFDLNLENLPKFKFNDKILFLCSPNNPTGNLLSRDKIIKILAIFPGIVVVDEAYIEFAGVENSLIGLIGQNQRLIITRTLSKAWGLANLRVGFSIQDRFITELLYKIKPPYNLNGYSQARGAEILSQIEQFKNNLEVILREREFLCSELKKHPSVIQIFPTQANYILCRVDDAEKLYSYLVKNGIIPRNRSKDRNLENCIRFTVGSPEENIKLIQAISSY